VFRALHCSLLLELILPQLLFYLHLAHQLIQDLDGLARDLTIIAKDGTLDPVVGRDKEITRVIEVLCLDPQLDLMCHL
jgi:ATP-dependent Clp protease ATP-binding subunit ClpA